MDNKYTKYTKEIKSAAYNEDISDTKAENIVNSVISKIVFELHSHDVIEKVLKEVISWINSDLVIAGLPQIEGTLLLDATKVENLSGPMPFKVIAEKVKGAVQMLRAAIRKSKEFNRGMLWPDAYASTGEKYGDPAKKKAQRSLLLKDDSIELTAAPKIEAVSGGIHAVSPKLYLTDKETGEKKSSDWIRNVDRSDGASGQFFMDAAEFLDRHTLGPEFECKVSLSGALNYKEAVAAFGQSVLERSKSSLHKRNWDSLHALAYMMLSGRGGAAQRVSDAKRTVSRVVEGRCTAEEFMHDPLNALVLLYSMYMAYADVDETALALACDAMLRAEGDEGTVCEGINGGAFVFFYLRSEIDMEPKMSKRGKLHYWWETRLPDKDAMKAMTEVELFVPMTCPPEHVYEFLASLCAYE